MNNTGNNKFEYDVYINHADDDWHFSEALAAQLERYDLRVIYKASEKKKTKP